MQSAIAMSASELDVKFEALLKKFKFVDLTNIRSFAAGFCQEFDLRFIPRNPFIILPEVFGIRVKRAMIEPSVGAMWSRTPDDIYQVEYSEYRRQETLSITLWHELFEILSSHPAFPTRLTSDVECRLAGKFAINVLMPEVAIRKIAQEYGHPDRQDKTYTLAKKFFTSNQSMRLRLQEFALDYKRQDRKEEG